MTCMPDRTFASAPQASHGWIQREMPDGTKVNILTLDGRVDNSLYAKVNVVLFYSVRLVFKKLVPLSSPPTVILWLHQFAFSSAVCSNLSHK